jgi:hypothetical protein
MTRCSELQRDAAGIMALPTSAAERVAALRHAASCATCERALAQGASLLQLLDRAPADPAPRPEVLGAIERAVLAQMPRRRVGLAAPAAALLAGWGLLAAVKHSDLGELPAALPLLGAALAALFVARRGVVPLIAAALISTAFALRDEGTGVAPLIGLVCVATELVAAAFPAGAALWLARRAGAALAPLELATVAAAGALAGHAVLAMACPIGGPAHGLLFHAGGVLLAAAGGAALSRVTACASGSAA